MPPYMPTAEFCGSRNNGAVDLAALTHPPETEGVFLSRFVTNTPEQVHVIHGEVAVGNGMTRYKGYFPENRTQEGIGQFWHGLGGFIKSSEPIGLALGVRGLANIVVDQSHLSSSAWEDLTDAQAIHVETAEAVRKDLFQNSEILYEAPEGKQAINELLIAIAHSMGGLASTKYVEEHPDETEGIILLKTVGVNDPIVLHALKSIVKGHTFGGIIHELGPYLNSDNIEINLKNLGHILKYAGIGWPFFNDRRPTRLIGEVASCLFEERRESLQHIGELGKYRIGIEAGRDPLIKFAPDIVDYLDLILRFPKYGHMMPQHRPDLIADTILAGRQALVQPKPILYPVAGR